MGKKILLADDSITIQKVIELTFSDEDFEVVTVGNGRLAVERVLDVRPDIVLCDIIMPEKDGYEVCDFIKRSPQLSNVPVLLLTGAFEPFDQERAARVQCDGFLAKPFEPETLIAKVKDLLQKAASRGSSVTGPRMAVQVPPPAPPPVAASPSFPSAAAAPAFAPAPPVAVAPAPTYAPAPPPVAAAPVPPVAPRPVEPPPVAAASYEPPPPREAPSFAPPPPTEEVRFIPDEPFDDLESAGFGPPTAAVAPGPIEPEPTLPPAPSEPEVYSMADELEAGPDELLQMTAEESESLAQPAVEDSSSTVVFRPNSVPWAAQQQPTLEVPLEARAQASLESAQGTAPPMVEEATVFEEVLEEEVESLVGPEPSLEPEPGAPFEAPSVAAPAAAPSVPQVPQAPEAPPAPVEAAPSQVAEPAGPPPLPEPEPEPEPEPMAVPTVTYTPPPEPIVPALEHAMPVPAMPVPAMAAAPEPSSSIESFVGVAAPTQEPPVAAPSVSAEIPVPNDMVAQIAQRVVAQISEKVVRQIAWEVIPDLAEGLIKKEIERLKAELQQT